MPYEVPSRPWEQIAVDLFELRKKKFMVALDYCSNFWKVDRLTSTTSAAVILKLKNHFARYGCPDRLISTENGSPHQSSPSLLMNATSNTEPTVLATVKQTGKWNQQLKQQRTSTGKPWIPERTRTLRYSTTATHRPKEWSLVRYSA